MLVDQQAGRLAHSDKVLMCGTIKGLTTDWILETCSHAPPVLFLAGVRSGAVFFFLFFFPAVDCLLVNTALQWCEKADVWGEIFGGITH